jgi:hypothetical protein
MISGGKLPLGRKNGTSTPPARRSGSTTKRLLAALGVLVLLGTAGVAVNGILTSAPELSRIIPSDPSDPPGPTAATPTSHTPQVGTSGTAAKGCLSAERVAAHRVTKVAGSVPSYRLHGVPDKITYDLRGTRITGYSAGSRYPLLFGKLRPGRGTCVVGGTVAGRQSRALTWQAMKAAFDGDGLNFKSNGGVVEDIRIDNVEDGIGTIGGDPEGITIRRAYLTYIRDDCIENDAVVGLTVQDSLLDGCFFGLSQRPGARSQPQHAPPGERTLLDRVLLRIQPMPFEPSQARCAADGLGTGGFFKWSPYANRLVVKDSVLLAERVAARCAGPMHFPANASYQNVTLVWLGPGRYPGWLPPNGVTVTRDRRVWDQARADWLSRHGYASTP